MNIVGQNFDELKHFGIQALIINSEMSALYIDLLVLAFLHQLGILGILLPDFINCRKSFIQVRLLILHVR